MSMHINAKVGEIAERIVLVGDPFRAKHIAEDYLKDAVCVNETRAAYCYTGYYNGVRVSVMAVGMGNPSMLIYATELFRDYGVKNAVRAGTSGGYVEGMKMYDFNSEFKMAVPKDVRFLKSWNNSGDVIFGMGYSYFDKNNEISVSYIDSPLMTHEIIDNVIDMLNSTGNATFEFEGDMIISHNVKNNGKAGNSEEKSNFTETILLQKGHMVVGITGNDLDLIKSMAKTIEFYE